MKFSLIIPCYNEAKNIPLLLDRCKDIEACSDVEIILVDNGSTDNTSEVLKLLLPLHPNCRSIRVRRNQGYGFGILSGLEASNGDIIGWTHADMQTDPQDFLQGIELFEQHGKDIFVKGVRYGRPFMDIVFSVGMSIFETILLRRRMWDINAQPTMFSRDFVKSWKEPPNDFSLDLYSYYQAVRNNLKVYRFPVKFGERAYGISHWNVNWTAKRKFIYRTVDFSLKLKKKLSL